MVDLQFCLGTEGRGQVIVLHDYSGTCRREAFFLCWEWPCWKEFTEAAAFYPGHDEIWCSRMYIFLKESWNGSQFYRILINPKGQSHTFISLHKWRSLSLNKYPKYMVLTIFSVLSDDFCILSSETTFTGTCFITVISLHFFWEKLLSKCNQALYKLRVKLT